MLSPPGLCPPLRRRSGWGWPPTSPTRQSCTVHGSAGLPQALCTLGHWFHPLPEKRAEGLEPNHTPLLPQPPIPTSWIPYLSGGPASSSPRSSPPGRRDPLQEWLEHLSLDAVSSHSTAPMIDPRPPVPLSKPPLKCAFTTAPCPLFQPQPPSRPSPVRKSQHPLTRSPKQPFLQCPHLELNTINIDGAWTIRQMLLEPLATCCLSTTHVNPGHTGLVPTYRRRKLGLRRD